MLYDMAAKQPGINNLQWLLQATHGEMVEISLHCNDIIDYGVEHKI